MKCRIPKPENHDFTKSTFTVYNQDGTLLKENATFEEVYSKEGLFNLIFSDTSVPLRVVEN